MRSLIVSSVIVLLAAGVCSAGQLAPKKPSDTVVLSASPSSGPCVVEQIATQVAIDGSELPFLLAPGKALMITDINWMVKNATPGDTVGLEFHTAGADVAVIVVDGEANGRGVARGQTHFSTPVRLLGALCANPVTMDGTVIPTLQDVRVMGFVTSDH
jgi:hypothetical protein